MPNDDRVEATTEPRLRVEAGAAQWEELDEAQQVAYVSLAKMIAETLMDMPPLDRVTGLTDAIRRTRSSFITGDRGTGKTTVLETFKRDSRVAALEAALKDGPDADDETRSRLKQLHAERETALKQIRGRVVWLETLDMEPLSPDTNLLASILARLEDAARVYGVNTGTTPRTPRGLVEPSSEYHDALLELQRLQTDVALAWDGNLQERQGALDPDAFALEVMRVERARLSLNTKFAETLRKLAAYVFQGRDFQNVLFVLPVDDFDLNPPMCLDLLRALRLISVPRLFTVVLGDMRVASTVLSLKLSNDLGSIARRLHMDMLAVPPGSVAALAGDVCANAIRKLLPPGQRVHLRPMLVDEAMNFRPLGSTKSPSLYELLSQCTVTTRSRSPESSSPPERISLLDLLITPPLSVLPASDVDNPEQPTDEPSVPEAERARIATKNPIYFGTKFFAAPPRRVADTWFELYRIMRLGKSTPQVTTVSEPLLTYFAEASRAALREAPAYPIERDAIERMVSRTVAGAWTLRPLPVLLTTENAERRPIELTLEGTSPAEIRRGATRRKPRRSETAGEGNICIVTADSLGWQMEFSGGERTSPPGSGGIRPPGLGSADTQPRRLLPNDAVTSLVVYHDLLELTTSDSFVSPLLTPASLEIDWALTEWNLSSTVRFNWLAPPATTFLDYDRFRGGWNAVIKAAWVIDVDHAAAVERLAFAWLSLGTAVVTNRAPLPLAFEGSPPWNQLIALLEGARLKGSAGDRYKEWIRRILEMLMPEMGWPPTISPRFDQATRLHERWQRDRLTVKQRRARRLRQLHEVDSELALQLRDRTRLATQFAPEPAEFSQEVE
jgi:hypothetical protein